MTSSPPATKWKLHRAAPAREYLEVLGVLAAVTFAGWFVPVSYHIFGQVYLLTVIALSLRVGRWPALVAAVVSAVAWNYVFIPPRLSFSVLDFDDGLILGTYFVVAITSGQLTSRIRAQERYERVRERHSRALFHLTRALAGARTLDEAVAAALRQADELFGARTAVLLIEQGRLLAPHPASSLALDERELEAAEWAWRNARPAGRFTETFATSRALHVPMLRADAAVGVLVLRLPDSVILPTEPQSELIDGFAAQIALLIEREQLRAAAEREKLLLESDRLRRTLLDSVSHELKTPLAVLRAAAENLGTNDGAKLASLTSEIRTATRRLDRLVANLLNQTRLESGAITAQLDWCDARDLIGAARRALGDALAGRNVKIEIPEEMPLFMADAPLMEQVIANLVLNAVLHTPSEAAIIVTTGVAAGSSRVFISVADRGPGIPWDLRATLFQKFHRGKDARAGGLGLGLSIVHGFMLAQGGEVIMDDNPGGGARFAVYLPCTVHSSVPNE